MLFVIALLVVVSHSKNRVWGWVSGSLICGSYDIRLFSQIIVNYLWFLRTSLPSPHFPSGVFPFCLLNGLEFSPQACDTFRGDFGLGTTVISVKIGQCNQFKDHTRNGTKHFQ